MLFNRYMPKKKKQKSKKSPHLLFNTRKGYYSLVIILVILMISTIKMLNTVSQEEVLGEKTQEQKEKREMQEREEKEQRKEERKAEIKKEFNIEAEEVQIKFESEEGNLKRKVETKTHPPRESKIEKEEELIEDVEKEFNEEQETEIESSDEGITLEKNDIKAKSGFPLSIDVATNELTVTKRDGTTKIVTVLPDAAVANFMRHKKVELLNVEDTESSTSASIANTDKKDDTEKTEIKLIEKDNELVYEIKGKKKLKALGFIPVTADTTGYISAETGDVISEDKPILTRILDFISF